MHTALPALSICKHARTMNVRRCRRLYCLLRIHLFILIIGIIIIVVNAVVSTCLPVRPGLARSSLVWSEWSDFTRRRPAACTRAAVHDEIVLVLASCRGAGAWR